MEMIPEEISHLLQLQRLRHLQQLLLLIYVLVLHALGHRTRVIVQLEPVSVDPIQHVAIQVKLVVLEVVCVEVSQHVSATHLEHTAMREVINVNVLLPSLSVQVVRNVLVHHSHVSVSQ